MSRSAATEGRQGQQGGYGQQRCRPGSVTSKKMRSIALYHRRYSALPPKSNFMQSAGFASDPGEGQ
jgi:hypothetical protein